MKLLLDTHTVLWVMLGSPQITRPAQIALRDLENKAYVSVVSVWEAATKFRLGKLPIAAPLVSNPRIALQQMKLEILPLELEHAHLAGSMSAVHKDPFDRMLAAQALLEGLTLVSNDAVFDSMLVTRLW
jgi:PIN domain nuclease of toxin-antitoxin system